MIEPSFIPGRFPGMLFAGFVLSFSSLCIHAGEEAPKFIAHRGASADAPENTMAAFQLAWEQGADGIEADFFLSADGQVVCIHDKNTKKTGSGNLEVGKSTLAQLRSIEYGAWKNPKFKGEPIPILADVLDGIPEGKWFFLEIKDSGKIVPAIAEIIKAKRPDTDRLVIISFHAQVIQACSELLPEYRAILLSDLKDFNKPGQAGKFAEQLRSSGSRGLAYKEHESIPAAWLSEVAGDGGILATWTINTPAPALRAIERGVDFIITDRPAALRREVNALLDKPPVATPEASP
jgi:glycerophosphoryl diester phosphodiesterase